MEFSIGPTIVRGYVAQKDTFKALQEVVDTLGGTVYGSDEYNTGNYGMTRVKITIEVE